MKTKFNIILFSLLLLSTIFLFSSCGQKNSNCGYDHTTDIYYKLSDDSKSKIPYTGYDTLIFKSDAGDTATLYGQGKKIYYETTTSGMSMADCGSTPQYTYHFENIEIDFKSVNPFLYQIGFIAYKNQRVISSSTNDISILVNNFEISGSNFEYANHSISIPEDSILLNGTYQTGGYINPQLKNVLFNFSKGILKFKDKYNITWTKLK